MRYRISLLVAALALSPVAGCKKNEAPSGAARASAEVSAAASSSAPERRRLPSVRRTGSVIARTIGADLLLVADEDNSALRIVPLPLDQNGNTSIELPGPAAQVLVRDGEAWVTVRDPGMAICFAIEGKELREVARVKLPDDAWGMGLSPDESKLLVTSPWSNAVTLIDVGSRAVIKTLTTAREPRAAVFTADNRAYVTHLVGTALTRLDLGDEGPQVRRIPLTAGPLRAPFGAPAGASLAYAAALSPDGRRLFVPRHALGTYSTLIRVPWESEPDVAWFGSSAVDILQTASEEPLAPNRSYPGYLGNFGTNVRGIPDEAPKNTRPPIAPPTPFVQPRDVLYRASTKTLLVVSEGTDRLVEVDARAVDPTLGVAYSYETGDRPDPKVGVATAGAAPQGLALSADERTAWVFARGTHELVTIPLVEPSRKGAFRAPDEAPPDSRSKTYVRLGDDPLGPEASLGRRVFFNASDRIISGGLGCAGCHPEGRDDGFVWREAREKAKEGEKPNPTVFVGHPLTLEDPADDGRARQTPMLAGRVDADGPYGWHGQNKDIEERVAEGFRLHRWSGRAENPKGAEHRIKALAAFLRKGGLRPPPVEKRALSDDEAKGKEIFLSDRTACASCHPADSGYTNRASVPLSSPLPTRPGFAADEDQAFKVPSLLFVKNTAPYYHDGSAQTLDELISKNNDRMGKTNHLNADEKKALVAFLKTL